MKIFHIGIPTNQIASLESHGIVALTDNVQSPDDVKDWISDGGCEAVVLNLEHPTAIKVSVQDMRGAHVTAPIVGLLSAQGQSEWSERRAFFLEVGCDDLVMAPMNLRELAASLRAVTRRQLGMTSDIKEVHYKNAHIVIDFARQSITVNSIPLRLTRRPYLLFLALVSSGKHIHSREYLLERMYNLPGEETSYGMVRVRLTEIRKHLREIEPDAGEIIEYVSERKGWRLLGE
jgi:DNA-binding response OmpR family regulator